MTLNQLTYFYKAATLEHFNLAAEQLHISEPSLSRSIHSLEDELGLTLFEKKGRNVTLTKAGKIFLFHAEKILTDVSAAEEKMSELSTDGGHIDIAYVAPLARKFIPSLVRAFLNQKENKNVVFNFYQNYTDQNLKSLKAGTVDLIFGSYVENEPSIEFVPIIKQDMVVILPVDHPLAKYDALDHTVFTRYPVAGYTHTSGLGGYSGAFFKEHNINPDIICESPDENSIASFVAEGFGIALVADVHAIHRDDIVIKPLIPEEKFYHQVYMAYQKDIYMLPAVQRLISFITNAVKDGYHDQI